MTGRKVVEQVKQNKKLSLLLSLIYVASAIFLFLLSIDLMAGAFNRIGKPVAEAFLSATSNPFIGLFMGLLITAIIQSSSTTTSMVVAVVASGSLSLSSAIPIVMGANIGTTFTSTIIALGYVTNNKEFNKAISAGTLHDFFNILVTCIIFPLEYFYGFLTYLSSNLTDLVTSTSLSENYEGFSINIISMSPISQFLLSIIENNWFLILLSFLFLYLSIKILSKVIYKLLIGDTNNKFNKLVFTNPLKSFGWGLVLTSAVQSSSVTTSLTVPLVATGKVSLKNAFPFIMGANLGTTITAIFASLLKSDAAISLAFAHFLFNVMGVLIFFPIPWMRNIPVYLSKLLGMLTMQHKIIGFIYIFLTFFILPFLLIYLSQY